MNDYELNVKINCKTLSMSLRYLMEDANTLRKKLSLKSKPNNFVLDTWVYYHTLINGRTMVWYYCDVIDDVVCKVI